MQFKMHKLHYSHKEKISNIQSLDVHARINTWNESKMYHNEPDVCYS